MILGIGSDLCDIRRIEKVVARHGDRFINRVFTETERSRAEHKAGRMETYAKRFAAKEACAKALGTGFRRGVFFRDLGVVNLPSGRPTMALTGGEAAAPHLLRITSKGKLDPAFGKTGQTLPGATNETGYALFPAGLGRVGVSDIGLRECRQVCGEAAAKLYRFLEGR